MGHVPLRPNHDKLFCCYSRTASDVKHWRDELKTTCPLSRSLYYSYTERQEILSVTRTCLFLVAQRLVPLKRLVEPAWVTPPAYRRGRGQLLKALVAPAAGLGRRTDARTVEARARARPLAIVPRQRPSS